MQHVKWSAYCHTELSTRMIPMGAQKGKTSICYEVRKDDSRLYKFFLVNPKANVDIDALTERLIGFKDVKEVYVTDGDHGFVVKTRFIDGKEPKGLCSYIHGNIDSTFEQATAYYRYRKL